jgi:hypothetical protein
LRLIGLAAHLFTGFMALLCVSCLIGGTVREQDRAFFIPLAIVTAALFFFTGTVIVRLQRAKGFVGELSRFMLGDEE